jgi:uncharacterized lipoprotein YajG
MKKQLFKTVLVLLALAFMLSGCASNQNSLQSAASTTVSGYVSVGAGNTIH